MALLVEVYKSSLYASVNAHIAEARRRRAENADWPPEEALVALVQVQFLAGLFQPRRTC